MNKIKNFFSMCRFIFRGYIRRLDINFTKILLKKSFADP